MKRILMKRIFFITKISILLILCSCNKDAMYENINKLVPKGETVYPAKFDTTIVTVGIERIEVDLISAGRIPAKDIYLGKAVKTLIEAEGIEPIEIDSVCSWVNITGLKEAKLYRFKIYTVDKEGNRSVPVEATGIPYTNEDANALEVSAPRITASPWAASIDWPRGINSLLFDYYGLTYSYTDKDGKTKSASQTASPVVVIENVLPDEEITVNVSYKIVPRVDNKPILDTLTINRPIKLTMPSQATFQSTLLNRSVASMMRRNSQNEMQIAWVPADTDPTLLYTVVTYLDYTGQQHEVKVANSDTKTIIEGMKTGDSFSVASWYNPVGSGDLKLNALPKEYTPPTDLLLARDEWTVVASSDFENQGFRPELILDNNLNTYYHSRWSGGSPGLPHWIIIDMGSSLSGLTKFDTYRMPSTGQSPDTKTVQYMVSDGTDPETGWIKIAECEFNTTKGDDKRTHYPLPEAAIAQGRYLKINFPDITGLPGREWYVSLSEIYLYGSLINE